MPVYQPNIPTGSVELDQDYLNILGNFQQLNIVYGTDHYPFDNAVVGEQGFHNVVTTPIVVNNPADGLPPATTTHPKFYAFQQYGALGVLQYSRGPTNAVPTPLTSIHSTVTPIVLANLGTTNILDFTGFSFAIGTLEYMDANATANKFGSSQIIRWSNNAFQTFPLGSGLLVQATGNMLQLINNSGAPMNNVYWTLRLTRVQ